MPLSQRSRFLALSAANFFSRYHYYLIAFIISTFLAGFIGESNAGFAIAGANVGAVIALALMPEIFKNFGTKSVLTFLGLAEIVVLLSLAFAHSTALVILLLVLTTATTFSIFLGLDLLVESITTNEGETGSVRGVFLTATNISTLIASLSLAAILTDENYRDVFFAAALVLVPFIMLTIRAFPRLSSTMPAGEHISFRRAIKNVTHIPPALQPVIGAHFLLQLYYAWCSFYFPLYLFQHVGFSWHTIGIVLALSIVPFLVLELPLGWIADHWLGEQEIMIAGFVLLAGTTAALSWSNGNLIAWVILFMLAACGASAVEIMTETAFFKQVNEKDGSTISLLRMLRPLGGILGPATAGALLLFLPPSLLFLVFGVVLAVGIPLAISMVDTL